MSAQAVATGISASVLGYSSSVAVVITGLTAAGASTAQVTSGLAALGVLMGLCTIAMSITLRLPVSVVWSTPGVALLATVGELKGGFAVTVGAMVVAAGLIVLTGLVRPLTGLVAKLPPALSAAVLAGVLLPFCLQPAQGVADLPWQAGPIALTWLVVQRYATRWSAPAALLALVVVVLIQGDFPAVPGHLPSVALIEPHLTWDAVVQVALPLYLVTMAGQNLVGLAVLRTEGYEPPVGTILVGTGITAAAAATFGAPTTNLAAITGALTAGPQAHPDPARRWVATTAAGSTYLLIALLAPITSAVVTGVDPRLVGTAAGLALLGALAASASAALKEERTRMPALITLLVTASGITGAPALGLAAGLLALLLDRTRG